MTLAHFYHVWADGDWERPVTEHLHALEQSGLAAALTVKCAGITGSPARRREVTEALGGGWEIVAEAGAGHEEVTLRALRAFATGRDGAVFYAHTKAAWHTTPEGEQWRRAMTDCCAGQWRRCVQTLEAFDCAGPRWLTAGEFPGRGITTPFYSGNFWWANLSHLRKLGPVENGGDRYRTQEWLGSAPVNACSLIPAWPDQWCHR